MTVPRNPVLEARIERVAREGYERARAALNDRLRAVTNMTKSWDELTAAERLPHLSLARSVITGEGEIEF